MSYSNADEPHTTDPHVIAQGGQVLDQVRLQSAFRQDWDVRDSPFDHHRIEVLLTAPDLPRRARRHLHVPAVLPP
ncbi:hypothetical protein ACFPFX_33780 [Streptomyces mauvecolor]|uniref:Uncharacterized protein n=1 Tax=Streptomyces mauvecolor TaxID=58345 RepID=A0ABV9UVR1_9ACTN